MSKKLTWSYDNDGDFTHVTSNRQWQNKAWFRPNTEINGLLRFGFLGQENVGMTRGVYSVYHGRFIEMLLSHFHLSIESLYPTVEKHSLDNFSWAQ